MTAVFSQTSSYYLTQYSFGAHPNLLLKYLVKQRLLQKMQIELVRVIGMAEL